MASEDDSLGEQIKKMSALSKSLAAQPLEEIQAEELG